MKPNIKEHILSIYPTPVCNYQWPDTADLNLALKDAILQRESETPGISRSNVGGWHSETGYFESDIECIKNLRDRIRVYVEELFRVVAVDEEDRRFSNFTLDAWANVLRFGQYNSLHSHPNSFWSGVYYVTGNQETKMEEAHAFSGKLELIDPRPGAGLNYTEGTSLYGRFLVNPLPGQMLVFPGWLQHQVHPYFGESERISIAFNVTVNTT